MSRRDQLLFNSLSPNSWKAYNTAWRSFTKVLSNLGFVSFLPLREQHLEIYVVAASDTLAYGTIKSYLSGIKFWHLLAGFSLDSLFQDRLRLLLRGVRRIQGNSRLRPKRIPITLQDLHAISSWVTIYLPFYDATLLQAALRLAFFGLLRISEFTCAAVGTFQVNTDLALQDVQVDEVAGFLRIYIKVSKSDPFRQGFSLRIAKTDSDLCPFTALISYLSLRRPLGPGPLFILSNGQFLTRDHVVLVLSRVFPHIPSALLGSHSFRIGGASRLCALGVPDATIQILGRWSSSAFKRYLHLSDSYVGYLHDRMSRDVNRP